MSSRMSILVCACVALIAGVASSQPTNAAASRPDWSKFRPAPRIQLPFKPIGKFAPAYDLRPQINALGIAIRDQGDRGTCSVFATTFLIEFAEAKARNIQNINLSEEFLNWAKNAANNIDQDGGFFYLILNGYQADGMVVERAMPYKPAFNPKHPDTPTGATIADGRKFDRFPVSFLKDWDNSKGVTEQEFNAIKATIRAGTPVATGIWWLSNFETRTIDNVPILKEYPRAANSGANPPMFDGHSIDLVGYTESKDFPGGGYFIFRNSFGTGFGDDGYGYISFKYIHDYANDAIMVSGPAQRSVPIKPHCKGTSCL